MTTNAPKPRQGGENKSTPKPRILVAYSQPDELDECVRILGSAGYQVQGTLEGYKTINQMHAGEFSAVICGIEACQADSLDMVKVLRTHDLDVPVVLMGTETQATWIDEAFEQGVLRYLNMPIEPAQLIESVGQAVLLHRMARKKRQTPAPTPTPQIDMPPEEQFMRALDSLWMAYQPIVSWRDHKIYGYEALVRGTQPSLLLPQHLLDTAERLGRLRELSQTIRNQVADDIRYAPEQAQIFVNLHAYDLLDEHLYDRHTPLSKMARRVILEITERTALDQVADVTDRISALRALGYRIAVDDLGAGYAGLAMFAQLEPDVVKLDMSLVRNINTIATKRKLMQTMVKLCGELGMAVIAEGIETLEERDTLCQLGCDLMQGYLFALPERGFQDIRI